MLPNIDPLALTIILTFILTDTINQCPNGTQLHDSTF